MDLRMRLSGFPEPHPRPDTLLPTTRPTDSEIHIHEHGPLTTTRTGPTEVLTVCIFDTKERGEFANIFVQVTQSSTINLLDTFLHHEGTTHHDGQREVTSKNLALLHLPDVPTLSDQIGFAGLTFTLDLEDELGRNERRTEHAVVEASTESEFLRSLFQRNFRDVVEQFVLLLLRLPEVLLVENRKPFGEPEFRAGKCAAHRGVGGVFQEGDLQYNWKMPKSTVRLFPTFCGGG